MTAPLLSCVVALSENRVIGRDNQLPWHLPADLAHFKRLTLGKPVVMGRKVYDSVGKPLPGRDNIVLSRQRDFGAPGCQVVNSPQAALTAAGDVPEVMIIGGAQIYDLFLARSERIYLTLVHASVAGDTFFPELPPGQWTEEVRSERPADERNAYALSFVTLRRTPRPG